MKTQWMRWGLLLIALLLIFNPPVPKEALIKDVEGTTCSAAEECPCFGTYGDGTNWGIGVGKCTGGTCDMSSCLDLQPSGDYVWSHISDFAKTNVGWTLAIIGLLLMVIFWPKR